MVLLPLVRWVVALVATDKFASSEPSILSPYTRGVAITPSDSTDLAEIPRAINVHKGTGGTVTAIKVTLSADSAPVTLNFAVGAVIPIRPIRIWATGTDATAIVALY